MIRGDVTDAISRSEERIRGELGNAISGSEQRIRGELAEAITASEQSVRGDLADAISRSEERLGARIAASEAETRRCIGVLAEGLKSDIKLVAEGIVTLTERLGTEMRDGFETIDRRLTRVEARVLSRPEP